MLAYMGIIKCRIAKLQLTDTVCSRSGHCCRIRHDMLGDLELAVRHRAAQAEVTLGDWQEPYCTPDTSQTTRAQLPSPGLKQTAPEICVTPVDVKAPYVVSLRLEKNVVNRISLSPIDPFPVYPGFDGNVKAFFLFDIRGLII